jgi:poly-gamma-glutamate capsule biosynthesis protein CapA/YwtB (metallophosphatase superfamily)
MADNPGGARSSRAKAGTGSSAEDAAREAGADTGQAAGRAADSAAGTAQKMSEEVRNTAANAAQQLNQNVEATVARIRELNERAIEAARSAGEASLDAYEKALQSFVSVEERLANATQLDWVKAIVGAQSEFVQNISGVYVNAARDMLNSR